MKKIFGTFAICAMACVFVTSCGNKKEEVPAPAPEPVVEEVYQPQHTSVTVDLKTIKTYNYTAAPEGAPATSVVVNYDQKKPYQPIEIKFTYANGDTRTYIVPADFGLWKNQSGRFRVVSDDKCTVWLQGQTKKGKFCEFVFYGDPQFNGKKIKPNSYRNLPAGEIKYRK